MSSVTRYFRHAKQVALRGDISSWGRRYLLGAVGIRSDGATVTAGNILSRAQEPRAHAEARLTRKLDRGSVVYVVRVLRDGKLAIAKPCTQCQNTMRLRGVLRCYYSISDVEYGTIVLN